jgi:integrase
VATLEKRGDSWRAIVRRKGFPVQRATFDTKAEAQRWATLLERKLREQRRLGPLDEGLAESMKLTVADALQQYAEQVVPTKKNADSRRSELSRVRMIQGMQLGEMKLSDVRGRDVAAFLRDLEGAGRSPNTIRLYLATLSHCYTIARKEWGMESLNNPVQLVRKPRLPRGRERRLLPGEESDLIEAALIMNPELADIIILAIESAMRQGEILSMKIDVVDLKRHTVYLADTKNGERRTVPLTVRAEAAISRQQARVKEREEQEQRGAKTEDQGREEKKQGQLWSYTGEGLRASWQKARRRAGITGLTFHDLRHEATSRLFERGLNPMLIQTVTGHKTVQMLKRYTHLQADTLVHAVRGAEAPTYREISRSQLERLKGSVIDYADPLEPVSTDDWEPT